MKLKTQLNKPRESISSSYRVISTKPYDFRRGHFSQSVYFHLRNVWHFLASHPHLLIDTHVNRPEPLSSSPNIPSLPPGSGPPHPRYPPHRRLSLSVAGQQALSPGLLAHLCARLQPLVHLVDPILGLDHVGRVSPVEGSERRRVEGVLR